MASNFNSFAPYNINAENYSKTIFFSAQDRLEEVLVSLKQMRCDSVNNSNQPLEWPSLSLSGFNEILMYVKKDGEEDVDTIIVGVPLSPLEDGKVLFRFPGDVFGGGVGKYIGLVEVKYGMSDVSGEKIVTAKNYIPFEVREDFYCNPFDEYSTECSGGQ